MNLLRQRIPFGHHDGQTVTPIETSISLNTFELQRQLPRGYVCFQVCLSSSGVMLATTAVRRLTTGNERPKLRTLWTLRNHQIKRMIPQRMVWNRAHQAVLHRHQTGHLFRGELCRKAHFGCFFRCNGFKSVPLLDFPCSRLLCQHNLAPRCKLRPVMN